MIPLTTPAILGPGHAYPPTGSADSISSSMGCHAGLHTTRNSAHTHGKKLPNKDVTVRKVDGFRPIRMNQRFYTFPFAHDREDVKREEAILPDEDLYFCIRTVAQRDVPIAGPASTAEEAETVEQESARLHGRNANTHDAALIQNRKAQRLSRALHLEDTRRADKAEAEVKALKAGLGVERKARQVGAKQVIEIHDKLVEGQSCRKDSKGTGVQKSKGG